MPVARLPRPRARSPLPQSGRGAGRETVSYLLPLPRSLAELIASLGGEADDPLASITTITALATPGSTHDEHTLIPLLRAGYLAAAHSACGVVLTTPSLGARLPPGRRWLHPDPTAVLAALLGPAPRPADERHLALIDPAARVAASACIGAGAVLRAGVTVGEDVVVEARVVLEAGVELQARSRVGAGSILGRPGFGWLPGPDGSPSRRLAHPGGVVVEPDADLGALCTVDAGVLEPTRIGRGARLDSHVHVAHGVSIGAGSHVAAQSGFAGSVRVGQGVLVGGQVGVADHLVIGDGARLAARSGVIGDVPPGQVVAGYPAMERGRWLRSLAHLLAAVPRRASRKPP